MVLDATKTYNVTGEVRTHEPNSVTAVANAAVTVQKVASALFAANHEKKVYSAMGCRWVPIQAGELLQDLTIREKSLP